jgi:hypothetical protein
MILAAESRDMAQDESADTTAALVYDAVDLTFLGETKEAEREGVKVARHENLPNVWLAILDSEHGEYGHPTHKGVRRVWTRIYDPGEEAGLVQLKLEWRACGTNQWSRNAVVSAPLVGGWALVDLGECRPESAALGDERWEYRIAARSSGTSGATIDIQRIYPLPTEQYSLVRQPINPDDVPTSLLAGDSFNQAEGNATGKTAEVGGVYGAVAGSDTTDFLIAGGKLQRTAVSDTGSINAELFFRKGRGIGVAGTFTDVAFQNDFTFDGDYYNYVRHGHIVSYVDSEHFCLAVLYLDFVGGTTYAWRPVVLFPGESPLFGPYVKRLPANGTVQGSLLSIVSGETLSFFFKSDGAVTKLIQVQNPLLGASGTCFLYDENTEAGAVTRKYDNLAVWKPELPVVCSAGRSIEFRSDGIFRQDPTDDVWGELIPIGSGGLHSLPSGLEGRKSRYIVIPSQGDFEGLPDSGDNPLEAQTFDRPAYLATREAAEE